MDSQLKTNNETEKMFWFFLIWILLQLVLNSRQLRLILERELSLGISVVFLFLPDDGADSSGPWRRPSCVLSTRTPVLVFVGAPSRAGRD